MRGWAMCLLAACYAPNPPQGAPCGERDACPAGQSCVQGRCSSSGSGVEIDASAHDADLDAPVPPLDAPPDTPPVPSVMRFGDRPGATDDTLEDTFLDGADDNMGVHDDLHVTSNATGPLLVRIDVTTVPTYAIVTSARLSFFLSFEHVPMGTDIDVFLMNESWTEGTGDFSPGIANATDRNPGEPWTTSGAQPPSRGSTPIATTTVAAELVEGDELSLTIPPSTVAAWIADPSSNHGVAIVVRDNGFYAEVRSTEADEANERPMFELMLQ